MVISVFEPESFSVTCDSTYELTIYTGAWLDKSKTIYRVVWGDGEFSTGPITGSMQKIIHHYSILGNYQPLVTWETVPEPGVDCIF